MEVRAEHGDDVNWLFIASDDIGDPKNLVSEKGWDASVFAMSDAVKDYHSGPMPTTYFYNASGKLVEEIKGAMHKEELQQKVEGLL